MLSWTVLKRSVNFALILLMLSASPGAIEALTITTPPNNLVSPAVPRNPINGTSIGPSRLIVTITVTERIATTAYTWNLGTSNPQLTGPDFGWSTSVGNGVWTTPAIYKYYASSVVMSSMGLPTGPSAVNRCTVP